MANAWGGGKGVAGLLVGRRLGRGREWLRAYMSCSPSLLAATGLALQKPRRPGGLSTRGAGGISQPREKINCLFFRRG